MKAVLVYSSTQVQQAAHLTWLLTSKFAFGPAYAAISQLTRARWPSSLVHVHLTAELHVKRLLAVLSAGAATPFVSNLDQSECPGGAPTNDRTGLCICIDCSQRTVCPKSTWSYTCRSWVWLKTQPERAAARFSTCSTQSWIAERGRPQFSWPSPFASARVSSRESQR